MTEAAKQFFSPHAKREILRYVLEQFPFPLALTYSRLQDALDQQEPVAAAWQVRDAFECLLKFSANNGILRRAILLRLPAIPPDE